MLRSVSVSPPKRSAVPLDGGSDAFTLIELLIVVAIIAILAAIAVPNFLEAQTRAKVARVLSDMRTVALGLEGYAVDFNVYPLNDGHFNVLPVEITTPIAYVQTGSIIDPFVEREYLSTLENPLWARCYTYTKVVTLEEAMEADRINRPVPFEGIDAKGWNWGAFRKYGKWRLCSNGPDKRYDVPGVTPAVKAIDIIYDPTNGTISWGNILRTQKDPRPSSIE